MLTDLHCSLWPIQTINFPRRGTTGVPCDVKSTVIIIIRTFSREPHLGDIKSILKRLVKAFNSQLTWNVNFEQKKKARQVVTTQVFEQAMFSILEIYVL